MSVNMSLAEKKIVFTYQDLLNWEDDQKRHELIEGEHFMTPSPNTHHQEISMNLSWFLRTYIERHKLGKLFAAPTDVVLSDMDVFVPDLFFIAKVKIVHIEKQYVKAAPDLVIEILSPATADRDRETKFKRYALYGVKEYWIVDPAKRQIEVFNLARQELIERFGKDGVLNTPTFPDIDLEVKKIF